MISSKVYKRKTNLKNYSGHKLELLASFQASYNFASVFGLDQKIELESDQSFIGLSSPTNIYLQTFNSVINFNYKEEENLIFEHILSYNNIKYNESRDVTKTISLTAGENLSRGMFVYINEQSMVIKADINLGREAHGFILNNANNNSLVDVFFEGNNNQVKVHSRGVVFLSSDGNFSFSSGNGIITQKIGVATSSNNIIFEPEVSILKL